MKGNTLLQEKIKAKEKTISKRVKMKIKPKNLLQNQ
jgi:hypothetical protein